MEVGFFTTLFQQFVALLSVFCIAPAPVYNYVSPGPPGIEAAAARDVGTPLRQEPLIVRAFQTQVDDLLGPRGLGAALAHTADDITNASLGLPNRLRVILDNGDVADLPGGAATYGIRVVDRLGVDTNSIIDAIAQLLTDNLALLPGGNALPGDIATLISSPRDQEFGALGRALLNAPTFILGQLQKGGPEVLPAALNRVGQQLVLGAASDAKALVTAVSKATQAVLALVPGAQIPKASFALAVSDDTSSTPGALEVVVRIPIAAGVAASDLAKAGADATVIVVKAVVRAVTDIANAARPRQQADEVASFAEVRQLTLPEAIAQAPRTIGRGVADAGGVLQKGTVKARNDFVDTARGRQVERELRSGDNLLVAGEDPIITGTDNGTNVDKLVGVKPSRPRPVLGAIRTVTGTLKAVTNGIRTALGLPPRKPRPDPTAEKELAPAS